MFPRPYVRVAVDFLGTGELQHTYDVPRECRFGFAADLYANVWRTRLGKWRGSRIDENGQTIDRFDGGTITIAE